MYIVFIMQYQQAQINC